MLPVIKTIPLDKIFIDARTESIFVADDANPNGRRIPHTNGNGYQRDPFTRSRWIDQRVPLFSDALCRPGEVSDRGDGTFAAIDCGGRWLMSQRAGRTSMVCRVHKNLSRREEAQLFSEFDSEVYKLRSVETFLAQLIAEEPMAVAIAKAVKPYPIAATGAGTLKCVGPLTHMYLTFAPDYDKGLNLIKATAQAAAKGWSGWTRTSPPGGRQVDTRFFTALGLLIEAAGDTLDKDVLHRVLTNNPMIDIERKVIEKSDTKLNTIGFAVAAAKFMATIYNRSFNGREAQKIAKREIDNTAFLETIENGGTYASLVRAARLHSDADDEVEAA
jgi:hypothetical protein